MRLDGLDREEEALGDLAVGLPAGGQLGDPALAGCQCPGALREQWTKLLAGRFEFCVRAPGDREGARGPRSLERRAQRLARLGAAVGPPQCGAVLHETALVLEARGRLLEHVDRIPEQFEAGLAALDRPERAQGDASSASQPPGPRPR